MEFPPTTEQQEAIDLFQAGGRVAIQAGAGTGKSSTLRFIAEGTSRKGRYLAFNRALVDDAKGYMPGSCPAQTIHSAAFAAVGRKYAHRLNSQRISSAQIARRLGIGPLNVQVNGITKVLQPGFLASYAVKGVKVFCQTADAEPSPEHIPYIEGIDLPTATGRRTYANNDAVRRYLTPAIHKVWADALDPDGTLRYDHSYYLKAWQLADPVIDADFLLVDEAQDVSPVMLSIIEQQTHAQIVPVGDAQQALYGILGAVDAMSLLTDATTTYLSQSFRFGPAIAEVANGVLADLGADLVIRGLDTIDSTVGPVETPDVILCRTNAHAVECVLDALDDSLRVHLVGGGGEVVSFARGAQDLQDGRRTDHPELACFDSWGEVREYVENDAQGGELKLLVQLIDKFGAAPIIAALQNMPREADADLVVSTAHKSKGRAWPQVKLGSDFPDPDDDGILHPDELRLLYVAATRAQFRLDVTDVAYFTPKKKAAVVEMAV